MRWLPSQPTIDESPALGRFGYEPRRALIFGFISPSRLFPFFLSLRRGLPQLPPLVSLRLRHQRVRLQAEPDHVFHRPHVLPGPGDGPQEGVPRGHPGPGTAHRRREPPQWLGLPARARRCNSKKQLHSLFDIFHSLMTKVNSVRALITYVIFIFIFLFFFSGFKAVKTFAFLNTSPLVLTASDLK